MSSRFDWKRAMACVAVVALVSRVSLREKMTYSEVTRRLRHISSFDDRDNNNNSEQTKNHKHDIETNDAPEDDAANRSTHEWAKCAANETRQRELTRRSRVLVTGGAGFIGSSLMAALASRAEEERPAYIVGLDNFNGYYSPDYKRARAERLRADFGLDVIEGDVCNATLLEDLLLGTHGGGVTHVVHLAAQAGVRYSLTHPLSYVRNNLECFVTLIEVVRKIPEKSGRRPALVYASSSSVYGRNKKIPFSELDAVTNPANLYGASKFMNEQIASAYHHIYGVKSVGLRFFTVYGPWGRPDMAAFLFTRAIETGKPLTLFNQGKMRRDFTYIDDIVDGVIRSMQHCARSATVFNLGNNNPVELFTFISTIEKELNAKARVVHKVSTAEIKETYADVSKARAQLGYEPKTSVEVGLKSFIDWYAREPRRHTFATGGDFNNRRLSSSSSSGTVLPPPFAAAAAAFEEE